MNGPLIFLAVEVATVVCALLLAAASLPGDGRAICGQAEIMGPRDKLEDDGGEAGGP